jgi:hypothetical protein
MKSQLTHFRDMITQSRAYFSIFKLPVILFTARFGFILEFIIELPFMVLCLLDRRWEEGSEDGIPEPQRTVPRGQNPRGRRTEVR